MLVQPESPVCPNASDGAGVTSCLKKKEKKGKKSAYSTGVHIREGGVITRKFKIVGNCRVSKNKNHK